MCGLLSHFLIAKIPVEDIQLNVIEKTCFQDKTKQNSNKPPVADITAFDHPFHLIIHPNVNRKNHEKLKEGLK